MKIYAVLISSKLIVLFFNQIDEIENPVFIVNRPYELFIWKKKEHMKTSMWRTLALNYKSKLWITRGKRALLE